MTAPTSAKGTAPPKTGRLRSKGLEPTNRQSRSRPLLAGQNLNRETWIPCIALIAAVFAFYAPVVHNDFITFDDTDYIADNLHVQKGRTFEEVKWAFTSLDLSNWHPVTWLSHELDVTVFGLRPTGHHLENVFLQRAECSFAIPDAARFHGIPVAQPDCCGTVCPCIRSTWNRWHGRFCIPKCCFSI